MKAFFPKVSLKKLRLIWSPLFGEWTAVELSRGDGRQETLYGCLGPILHPKGIPDDSGTIDSRRRSPGVTFSAASLWEITIKQSLARQDIRVDARLLRRGLLDNGYAELSITSEHAVNTDQLARTHKDPFDRILLAQAIVEGITLVTNDRKLARYPGPIRKV
jgi:PIN domain nuclease of toxin-antitoxin system